MERLNNWLMLLANIGVLIGIGFLAIEIQQNTEALERERRIAVAESFVQRNDAIADTLVGIALNESFGPILDRWRSNGSEGLSDEEMVRVRYYEWSIIFNLESQLMQYQQGLLDEEYYEHQFTRVVRRLGKGWEELGLVEIQKPSLRKEIRRVLDESPADA
jgi:hypothetical protein